MNGRLLALAATLAPLSVATIGSGQTAIAGIHRQFVDIHHWTTDAQFAEAFAISRMAPGPSSLLVTLLGLHVAGLAGAAVATVAMLGPTAVLVTVLAGIWARTKGARWQVALERGLRPVAAGLLVAAVVVLLSGLAGGWPVRLVTLGSVLLVLRTRIQPLALLGLGALACAALHGLGWLTLAG